MEYKCNDCNRNFKTQESLHQHNSMKHVNERKEKARINFKKYFIFSTIILIVILIALSINAQIKKPGQLDGLAKCLTEKEVVIYGNDYCQYTVKQLNFFGKSQKYLNYVKCSENNELCDSKNIQTTPTWEINGEMYSQVQPIDKLAAISECEI